MSFFSNLLFGGGSNNNGHNNDVTSQNMVSSSSPKQGFLFGSSPPISSLISSIQGQFSSSTSSSSNSNHGGSSSGGVQVLLNMLSNYAIQQQQQHQWIGRENEMLQYILKLSHNPLSFRLDDHFIQQEEIDSHNSTGLIEFSNPYQFDSYYSAQQVNLFLKSDSNLQNMYDILVPKYVDDITFWKSYFYCLHRILFTQNIDELDEEICELYNKRRRQQMERELELQEYCNAIDSDCKIILMIIKMEIENINQILQFEKNLNNQIIDSIEHHNDPSHNTDTNQSTNESNQTDDHNTTSATDNNQSNDSNGTIDNQTDQTDNNQQTDNSQTDQTDNSSNQTDTNSNAPSSNKSSSSERKRREEEYHVNKQLIEEKIREVIEIKKKVSLFSSEIITNETLIERISQSNHCFMTTFTEYTKYKELSKELSDESTNILCVGTSVGGRLRSCSNVTFSPQLLNTNRNYPITTEFQRKKIVSSLPARYHLSNWTLLYSTLEHGISIKTLYRKSQDIDSSILIIKTMDGNVLGAFNSIPYNERGHKYYGNGEIMLYSFKNSTNIKTYHWTKLNDFFIRSTDSMICYGGDEFGRSSLIIDGELLTGSTNICKTFSEHHSTEETPLLEQKVTTTPSAGNTTPTLVKSQSITTFSTEVDFEIYALEVWGFEQIVKKENRSNSVKTNVAATTLLDYSHY